MKRAFLAFTLVVSSLFTAGYLIASGPACTATLPCGAFCGIVAPKGGSVNCFTLGDYTHCYSYNANGSQAGHVSDNCPALCGPCPPLSECLTNPELLCDPCCYRR